MRDIPTLAALKVLIGQEVAVSAWFGIPQSRIDQFAEATDDHQWIHVDRERAERDSPYGDTVAHGFLTLALLPAMLASALTMVDMKMGVNYGLNRVRFPGPVPVNSRVRGRLTLSSIHDLPDGGAQLTWDVIVEREGSDKPVCVAEFLMRRY
ncbi:MAG: MaoC family dehydratase [Pseudomonadota bacterium]|nr:MaoC family dehydratase [Pseudomonadota bacterium]